MFVHVPELELDWTSPEYCRNCYIWM